MSRSRIHDTIAPLLAILAIAAAAPTHAASVIFTGTEMNDTPPPMGGSCAAGQVYISFSPSNATVSGTSNLGSFAPTMAHCLSMPPTTYSGGAFTFDFGLGDELIGTYSGFFSPTLVTNVLNSTVNFVVGSGTGRFLGATGSFTGTGLLDRTVPRPLNNLNLTGVLDLPAVPEPATWITLLLGFFGLGAALRTRRGEPNLQPTPGL